MMHAPPLSLVTQLGLGLGALGLGVSMIVFAMRQQRGGLGGRIAPAKAAWLMFALLYWFIVCPLLALDPGVPDPWAITLGVFAIQMWARGLIELYMLYGPKNWRPRYGISHDIFSLTLVISSAALAPRDPGAWDSPWGKLAALAWGTLVLSLALETGYAIAFNKLVAGKTTGDDGVWFTDPDDPKSQRVNTITALFNVPLYAALAILMAAAWGALA